MSARTRGGAMSRAIHVFRTPDRFVAGTVGEPGDRSFYLQAVHESRVVSVLLEKQQVQVLADRMGLLLEEVHRRFGTEVPHKPTTSPTSARWSHRSTRSSGSARWGSVGTPMPGRSSWSCLPSARRSRRIGCPRRRRRRSGRGPCVPDSGASARVFAAVRTRHRGGTRAVPAVW